MVNLISPHILLSELSPSLSLANNFRIIFNHKLDECLNQYNYYKNGKPQLSLILQEQRKYKVICNHQISSDIFLYLKY